MPELPRFENFAEKKIYVSKALREMGYRYEIPGDKFYLERMQRTALMNARNFNNFDLLAKSRVLHKKALDAIIVKGYEHFLLKLMELENDLFRFYVSSGMLSENTIVDFCNDVASVPPLRTMPVALWDYMRALGLWRPPKGEDKERGFTVPDWEYTLRIASEQTKSRYISFDPQGHPSINVQPLLWAIGAHERETFEQYNRQVAECAASNIIHGTEPWEKQFSDLFTHYLTQTETYHTLTDRGPTEDDVRRENALRVNRLQYRRIRHDIRRKHEPLTSLYFQDFLDQYLPPVKNIPNTMELASYIRFRDTAEQMDRFAAAIYTKAMEWMIRNDYSRLFSHISILPRNPQNWPLARPKSVEAAAPNARYVDASGKFFLSHALFGRIVIFTHSSANEMGNIHSMPIVTRATAENKDKLPKDFVLMNVDHDLPDPHRKRTHRIDGPNYAGDIKQMINEMLRAILELEDRELVAVEEDRKTRKPRSNKK